MLNKEFELKIRQGFPFRVENTHGNDDVFRCEPDPINMGRFDMYDHKLDLILAKEFMSVDDDTAWFRDTYTLLWGGISIDKIVFLNNQEGGAG